MMVVVMMMVIVMMMVTVMGSFGGWMADLFTVAESGYALCPGAF